jgi:hypothetical protein
MAYAGLLWIIRNAFRSKTWSGPFSFAAFSFIFILVAISFSRFKMPHYIIMLLPLAAWFTSGTAGLLLNPKGIRFFYPVQVAFAVLVLFLSLAINFYFFPPENGVLTGIASLLIFFLLVVILKKESNKAGKVILLAVALSLVLNFSLYYIFFPSAMKYQGGNELVNTLKHEKIAIPDQQIMLVELHAHSFDFYRKYNHHIVEAADFPARYDSIRNNYFLLSGFLARHLESKGFVILPIASQNDYNVATMKWKFLNPSTRKSTFDTLMLAKIYRK